MYDPRISVAVPPDVMERIKKIALINQCSQSEVVRRMLYLGLRESGYQDMQPMEIFMAMPDKSNDSSEADKQIE